MNRNLLRVRMLVLLSAIVPLVAISHHSPRIHYDMSDIAELSGRVTEVDWANPHSIITVMGRESGGTESEWRIEVAAAAMIMRNGIRRTSVSVGDSVRAAGFRGVRNRNAIFMRNFLLVDGREWIAGRSIEPMWSDNVVGVEPENTQPEPTDDRNGIFRVWSVDVTGLPTAGAPRPLWNESYPLTAAAREARANWDRATSPYVDCGNGMPAIMDTPLPMEFIRQGEDIVLRFEELDARRLIFMGDTDQSRTEIEGPYGHSAGQWDGESLVVRTVAIDWPLFDQDGIPQTADMEIHERFTPDEEGLYLDYAATVIDDAVFTEPVVLERRWAGIPGEEIQAYACRWDDTSL